MRFGDWFKRYGRTIVGLAVAAAFVYAAPAIFQGLGATGLLTTTGTAGAALPLSFTGSIVAGAIAGGAFGAISSGSLQGALWGAAGGAAFGAVGGYFDAVSAKSILAHGVTGGTLEELRGGKFLQGFLAAGFAKLASPVVDNISFGTDSAAAEFGGVLTRTATAAVVGGTGSVIGGGKFENGAITGAFSRLFNDELHGGADETAAPSPPLIRAGNPFGPGDKVIGLDPAFSYKLGEVMYDMREQGYDLRVAEGYRTSAQQRMKVKGGFSDRGTDTYVTRNPGRHMGGRAADVVLRKYGWFPPGGKQHSYWNSLGAAAEARGLVWGGRWRSQDVAHVHLP